VEYYLSKNIPALPVDYTMTVPRGGTYSLLLSDSTRVRLNSSSTIDFPSIFPDHERRVSITGEVFFEVARVFEPTGKNQRKLTPFVVEIKNKNVKVEVLGTEFNVNAYSDESSIKTTLMKGSVKISSQGKSTQLKPGQQAVIRNNSIKVTEAGLVDLNAVKAWTEGNFDFGKKDIHVVLREIARWYDMEVEYRCEVPSRQFGGQVNRNTKLTEVLDALKINGIKCKVEGRKIIVTSLE
jgi:ferric-dicitrate binding protein FerR (iron transport regulator)